LSIQEPTPIVPPQEPLKGRDPTLAARTMGEVVARPDGSSVNRVVLPMPLVGAYETERIAAVTLRDPVTISEADATQLRHTLAALFHYPDGEHDIVDHVGEERRVQVSSRTIAHLTVGLDNEDAPVTHLAMLLERLKGSHDEIRAVASGFEPRVTECLSEAGLTLEADFAKIRFGVEKEGDTVSSGEAVSAPIVFVWRR